MSTSETTPDSFNAQWLALREPADTRARNDAGADEKLQHHLLSPPPSKHHKTGTLNILDLGAGTGANLRRLSPHLGPAQHWTLVDHDPQLLESLEERLIDWSTEHGAVVSRLKTDHDTSGLDKLAPLHIKAGDFELRVRRLKRDLATELNTLPFRDSQLVTASALLDLAGAEWLDALAQLCADSSSALLFALSYDGRVHWTPALADDQTIHEWVDHHQRTDKGLGMSLGPDAVTHFSNQLANRHGLPVDTCKSDWVLGIDDADLQRELARGYARAASEIKPESSAQIRSWLAARLAIIDAGDSALCVGHQEVLVAR